MTTQILLFQLAITPCTKSGPWRFSKFGAEELDCTVPWLLPQHLWDELQQCLRPYSSTSVSDLTFVDTSWKPKTRRMEDIIAIYYFTLYEPWINLRNIWSQKHHSVNTSKTYWNPIAQITLGSGLILILARCWSRGNASVSPRHIRKLDFSQV